MKSLNTSVCSEFASGVLLLLSGLCFIMLPKRANTLISLFGRSCLNHPDKKIVAYSSMILFTSLSSERMKELEENLNIAIDVVEAHRKQPESEWP